MTLCAVASQHHVTASRYINAAKTAPKAALVVACAVHTGCTIKQFFYMAGFKQNATPGAQI